MRRSLPVGAAARAGTRGHPARRSLRGIAVLMLALAALWFIPATPALAATGELYLTQATDPHGNIWLPGTTDGTTTGPMDPGTDPTSAGYGHLWTTDVPSGFCRIIPTTFNADGTVNKAAFLDRTTPGGCITAGGKAGQMDLDPRRNPDGTFYLYTPDWAVKSNGVYRLTYDPGKQIMTNAELLAPNRFPMGTAGQGIKPFDVQLGPKDRKLYVSNDINSSIDRITGVNGPISQQTVETNVGMSNDGKRVRAITFVCWSNLATLNGGRPVSRAPGATDCGTPAGAAANPAPDLVLAQFNSISVILNAEDCQSALGACVAVPTGIKVLTPMGLRTDPKDPHIVYVSDSPGADSQIVRYNIATDTQDSYANFGILDDGSVTRFSFAFSVGFDPQHAMYVGDDPSAGATAFNGRYFRVAPNAPADALGQPGVPAVPPPPPSAGAGVLYGGVFGTTVPPFGYSTLTLPGDGVWMPGSLGGHLWIPDTANGLCRMDVPPGGTLTFENLSTCVISVPDPANPGSTVNIKPEQSAFDAAKNLLYVSDGSSKSVGVVRYNFNPATETLSNPRVIAAGFFGTGFGIDGQRADAVAYDPLSDTLYVGFRTRKTGVNTQIARVHDPSAADTFGNTQTIDFVAKTTRDVPVFGLGIVVNPAANGAPATADLYIGDNKGVDVLYNVDACGPGQCTSLLLLNVRGPRGFATDGKDHLYMAGPPAPGTGNNTTVIQQYTISTGDLFAYTSVGVNPDGTQSQYAFVFSLGLAPNGDLYVADNAQAVAPPNNLGHLWKVAAGGGGAVVGPAQPTITSKPTSATNNTTPSFSFSTLTAASTYQCSLVASGAPNSFSACTSPFTPPAPLADGAYTFAVQAISGGVTSTPATYTFTVDTVPPVVTVTPPAKNPTNVKSPSFTFAANEAATFQCSLSTGADAFAACSSPFTPAAPLADGVYTFKVQGTDLAGNVGTIASTTLTIDTVVPVVTITAPPASPTKVNSPSFTFSSSKPNTTFQCSMSTGADAFASCPSPQTYTGLADGAYTFKVQGTDPAGNVSAAASSPMTIDTTAPTASASPPGGVYSTAQSVTLTATDATAVKIYYTTDGSTPTTASAQYASPISIASTTTLKYLAVDAAGNQSAVATQIYQIGAVSLDSKPASPTNNTTPSFAFSATGIAGATFECSLDPVTPGTFTACTSPYAVPANAPLADGSHTFSVRAVDGTGVTAPATYTFTVDTAPPVVTVNPPVKNPTNVKTPSFTFAANEAATFQCSLSTGADAFAACSSPQAYPAQADGVYTFKVKGTDTAGNIGTVVSTTLTIDTVAPVVAASPGAGTYATSQVVTLTATDATAVKIYFTTDGTTPTTASTLYGRTAIDITKSTTLKYLAVDAAGNQSAVGSQVYTITGAGAPPPPAPAARGVAPVAPPNPNPPPAPLPAARH